MSGKFIIIIIVNSLQPFPLPANYLFRHLKIVMNLFQRSTNILNLTDYVWLCFSVTVSWYVFSHFRMLFLSSMLGFNCCLFRLDSLDMCLFETCTSISPLYCFYFSFKVFILVLKYMYAFCSLYICLIEHNLFFF